MKRVFVLQHVPFEGPGAIAPWFIHRGYNIISLPLYAGATLPKDLDPREDRLVVMGGPMSVHDTAQYSWLNQEKDFLQSAVQNEVPILGVCLGAQLLAEILGAQVLPNPQGEIGWHSVARSSQGPLVFPAYFTPLHWHGETFTLPAGARPLGSSAACSTQGFWAGKAWVGLQFHLETTAASLDALLSNCRSDLDRPGKYLQTEWELRDGLRRHGAESLAILDNLLEYWILSQ